MKIQIPSEVIEKIFGKVLHGAIIGPVDATLFSKGETVKIKTQDYFAEYLI